MTRDDLRHILDDHAKWHRGEGGKRANLARADLADANLADAYLADAYLAGANLARANLADADLADADLARADLGGCVGNGHEIKTIHTDRWTVTYTAEVMQIGCQRHRTDAWWAFADDRINAMDPHALAWWRRWKETLRHIVTELSPAVPTGHETQPEAAE